jgi:hypothetical protein
MNYYASQRDIAHKNYTAANTTAKRRIHRNQWQHWSDKFTEAYNQFKALGVVNEETH